MYIVSLPPIVIWLIVGAIAGFLAHLLVFGSGAGILIDIVIGILGAFIAGWLFPRLGISMGLGGWLDLIVPATLGAVVLLLIIRLVKGF